MSKKFTGITSAGSAIPVYDKDAHSALQNKADVSALTAYQPVGDYYSASNPSGFLTAVPADMATTGDIADLAQSISETYQPIGNYQPSGDYYSASNPSGFITGVDLTPYQEKSGMSAYAKSADLLSVANTILIGSGRAWSSEWSSGYPCVDFEATKSALRHQYVPEGVGYASSKQQVNWNQSKSSEMFTFETLGGGDILFQAMYMNESAVLKVGNQRFDYKGGQNVISSFTVTGTTADNLTVSGWLVSQYQQRGTIEIRYSANAILPAHYDNSVVELAEKNDLSAYQTIEGMSAYQPSGDYQIAGDYLSASESANFYPMTGNPSGFLTEHQSLDGLMQTSGLEYDGDKISGYMGSAFKAGDELPSGVMVESAVGYNAVNEISGYNGSAIAQYGAEKQWLVHDDTLVHAANSAQYALGVNLSAVAQLLGVDETVLWEGELTLNNQATLSEKPTNFDRLKFYWRDWATNYCVHVSECSPNYITSANYALNGTWFGAGSATITLFDLKLVDDFNKTITFKYGTFKNLTAATTAINQANESKITKIVGIGRRSKEESLNE